MTDLGFDGAFNYTSTENYVIALKELCPQGIVGQRNLPVRAGYLFGLFGERDLPSVRWADYYEGGRRLMGELRCDLQPWESSLYCSC